MVENRPFLNGAGAIVDGENIQEWSRINITPGWSLIQVILVVTHGKQLSMN